MGVDFEMGNSKMGGKRFVMITVVETLTLQRDEDLHVSNLQEVNRALTLLQLHQLDAPRLKLSDFLLQLLQQLRGSPLGFLMLLLQLFHKPGLVLLNGGYEQAADLSTALDLPLCDFLFIDTMETFSFMDDK